MRVSTINLPLMTGIAIFLVLSSIGALLANPLVVAKTILHDNGFKTESVRNPGTKVLEEKTYNRKNILIARKVFELDSEGRALRGLVFDTKKKLIGRIQFGFDEFGRMEEERTWNAHNKLIKRLIYRYDKEGKRSRPMAFHYGGDEKFAKPMIKQTEDSSIATPDINGNKLKKGDQYIDGQRVVPKTSFRKKKKLAP